MISRVGKDFDVILISGEYWDDHPLSPVGVIAKVLESKGYSVGIIEKPIKNEDFLKLGSPKLFFGVTSGSIDSMLNNYTPLKKRREDDEFNKTYSMPDRAVIFYCNKIRETHKAIKAKIVIGGIEASLRRFAHYDYWDNDVRRSILLDSKADILVYGNGEKQIVEIAEKIKNGKELNNILGTTIISKETPNDFEIIPSFEEIKKDKIQFCKAQTMFSIEKNLAQKTGDRFVLQYKFPNYTSKDLDDLFALNFSRTLHPKSLLKMAKWSVVTHRGCLGNCNFCSITLHQGKKIISRTEKNILDELKKISKIKEFSGFIDDLGGPSANMYGMDLIDGRIDTSHKRLIHLMKKAREISGIKKIFVRSGVRYDFAMNSKEYIQELSKYHVSGCLKIAPEHVSENVLKLMNKPSKKLKEFVDYYNSINEKQKIAYYFMIGHPGDDIESVKELKNKMKSLDADSFQLFTPTPMTVSTCMYYTGLNPYTLVPINVVYDYNTKKKMKRILFDK